MENVHNLLILSTKEIVHFVNVNYVILDPIVMLGILKIRDIANIVYPNCYK